MRSRAPFPAFALVLLSAVSAHAANVTCSPTVVGFGSVQVSAPASTSTVDVTASGPGSVTVDGFIETGTGCAEVSATASTPAVLFSGETLVVTVAYDPVNRGADSCTVTVDDSDGDIDSFEVSGTGTAPMLSVGPASLSFADQRWNGGSPESKNITITNLGNGPIAEANLSVALTTGSQFEVGSPIGLPISPGESATVSITFDPASVGAKNDTATVSLDNDLPGDANPTVSLAGTGTQSEISLTPEPLEFGSYDPTTNSYSAELTVANGAKAPVLNLTSLSIDGTHAPDFSFTDHGCSGQGPCEPEPAAVGADESELFTLHCIGAAMGAREATLTVSSDDPDGPTQVSLTCLSEAFSDGFESGTTDAWSGAIGVIESVFATRPACYVRLDWERGADETPSPSGSAQLAVGRSESGRVLFVVESGRVGAARFVRAGTRRSDGNLAWSEWLPVERLDGQWTIEHRCADAANSGELLLLIDGQLVIRLAGDRDSARVSQISLRGARRSSRPSLAIE